MDPAETKLTSAPAETTGGLLIVAAPVETSTEDAPELDKLILPLAPFIAVEDKRT